MRLPDRGGALPWGLFAFTLVLQVILVQSVKPFCIGKRGVLKDGKCECNPTFGGEHCQQYREDHSKRTRGVSVQRSQPDNPFCIVAHHSTVMSDSGAIAMDLTNAESLIHLSESLENMGSPITKDVKILRREVGDQVQFDVDIDFAPIDKIAACKIVLKRMELLVGDTPRILKKTFTTICDSVYSVDMKLEGNSIIVRINKGGLVLTRNNGTGSLKVSGPDLKETDETPCKNPSKMRSTERLSQEEESVIENACHLFKDPNAVFKDGWVVYPPEALVAICEEELRHTDCPTDPEKCDVTFVAEVFMEAFAEFHVAFKWRMGLPDIICEGGKEYKDYSDGVKYPGCTCSEGFGYDTGKAECVNLSDYTCRVVGGGYLKEGNELKTPARTFTCMPEGKVEVTYHTRAECKITKYGMRKSFDQQLGHFDTETEIINLLYPTQKGDTGFKFQINGGEFVIEYGDKTIRLPSGSGEKVKAGSEYLTQITSNLQGANFGDFAFTVTSDRETLTILVDKTLKDSDTFDGLCGNYNGDNSDDKYGLSTKIPPMDTKADCSFIQDLNDWFVAADVSSSCLTNECMYANENTNTMSMVNDALCMIASSLPDEKHIDLLNWIKEKYSCPEGMEYKIEVTTFIDDRFECGCVCSKEDEHLTVVNGEVVCQPVEKKRHSVRAVTSKDDCAAEEVWGCVDCEVSCTDLILTCSAVNKKCDNMGCVCPDNMARNAEGKCVASHLCPCEYYGKIIRGRYETVDSCTYCTCDATEQVKCYPMSDKCMGVCGAYGDPHYVTLDGLAYEFQGDCSYTMLTDGCAGKDSGFSVIVQNVQCGLEGVSCTKSVVVKTEDIEINLLRGTKPTGTRADKNIWKVSKAGIFYLVQLVKYKITVKWDGSMRVYVLVDKMHKDKVCGLCANFNGITDIEDEYKDPSGQPRGTAASFANTWKVEDPGHECTDETTDDKEPCKDHTERKAWATTTCGIIYSPPFKVCNPVVLPDTYYKNCVNDACGCNRGGDCECVCTAIAAYADACSKKDITLKWRTNRLCPIMCDGNQVYTSSGTSCKQVCIPNKDDELEDCDIITAEGCHCPEGTVLQNGTCIARRLCPCKHWETGEMIDAGTIIDGDDECENCWCTQGEWQCKNRANCPETTARPVVSTTTIREPHRSTTRGRPHHTTTTPRGPHHTTTPRRPHRTTTPREPHDTTAHTQPHHTSPSRPHRTTTPRRPHHTTTTSGPEATTTAQYCNEHEVYTKCKLCNKECDSEIINCHINETNCQPGCQCRRGYRHDGEKCIKMAFCKCYDPVNEVIRNATEKWQDGCSECRCARNQITCRRNCNRPICLDDEELTLPKGNCCEVCTPIAPATTTSSFTTTKPWGPTPTGTPPCKVREGMSDPKFIPDKWITSSKKANSAPGDARPGSDNAFRLPKGAMLIIRLTPRDDKKTPVMVQKIRVGGNVAKFTIKYREDENQDWRSIKDDEGQIKVFSDGDEVFSPYLLAEKIAITPTKSTSKTKNRARYYRIRVSVHACFDTVRVTTTRGPEVTTTVMEVSRSTPVGKSTTTIVHTTTAPCLEESIPMDSSHIRVSANPSSIPDPSYSDNTFKSGAEWVSKTPGVEGPVNMAVEVTVHNPIITKVTVSVKGADTVTITIPIAKNKSDKGYSDFETVESYNEWTTVEFDIKEGVRSSIFYLLFDMPPDVSEDNTIHIRDLQIMACHEIGSSTTVRPLSTTTLHKDTTTTKRTRTTTTPTAITTTTAERVHPTTPTTKAPRRTTTPHRTTTTREVGTTTTMSPRPPISKPTTTPGPKTTTTRAERSTTPQMTTTSIVVIGDTTTTVNIIPTSLTKTTARTTWGTFPPHTTTTVRADTTTKVSRTTTTKGDTETKGTTIQVSAGTQETKTPETTQTTSGFGLITRTKPTTPATTSTKAGATTTTEGETSATGTTTIQVSAGTQETKTPETTQTTSGFGLITRTKPTGGVTTMVTTPTTTQNIILNATKTTPKTSRGTFPPRPSTTTTTSKPQKITTSEGPAETTTTTSPPHKSTTTKGRLDTTTTTTTISPPQKTTTATHKPTTTTPKPATTTPECEGDMEYVPCACTLTCEDIIAGRNCDDIQFDVNTDGKCCACPNGRVLKGYNCVSTSNCTCFDEETKTEHELDKEFTDNTGDCTQTCVFSENCKKDCENVCTITCAEGFRKHTSGNKCCECVQVTFTPPHTTSQQAPRTTTTRPGPTRTTTQPGETTTTPHGHTTTGGPVCEECPKGQERCDECNCFSESEHCDGHRKCEDGADERNCHCVYDNKPREHGSTWVAGKCTNCTCINGTHNCVKSCEIASCDGNDVVLKLFEDDMFRCCECVPDHPISTPRPPIKTTTTTKRPRQCRPEGKTKIVSDCFNKTCVEGKWEREPACNKDCKKGKTLVKFSNGTCCKCVTVGTTVTSMPPTTPPVGCEKTEAILCELPCMDLSYPDRPPYPGMPSYHDQYQDWAKYPMYKKRSIMWTCQTYVQSGGKYTVGKPTINHEGKCICPPGYETDYPMYEMELGKIYCSKQEDCSCVYANKTRMHGETFPDVDEKTGQKIPCTTCTCIDQVVNCRPIFSGICAPDKSTVPPRTRPTPPRTTTVFVPRTTTLPANCTADQCTDKRTSKACYDVDEEWYVNETCQHCHCQNARSIMCEIHCPDILCDEVNEVKMKKEGECCPSCVPLCVGTAQRCDGTCDCPYCSDEPSAMDCRPKCDPFETSPKVCVKERNATHCRQRLCGLLRLIGECIDDENCCECGVGLLYNGTDCVPASGCACVDLDGKERGHGDTWFNTSSQPCKKYRCMTDNTVLETVHKCDSTITMCKEDEEGPMLVKGECCERCVPKTDLTTIHMRTTTAPMYTTTTAPKTTTPRDACDVNDECHMDNDPRTCEQIADKAKIPGCEESDDYYLCLGKSLSCEDFITKCGCKDGYEDHGNVCIKPKPGCHLSTTPETSRGTFPPRTRPTSPRGSTTTTPRDACDVNDECHLDNDPRTCEQIADKAKIPGCEESDDYYLCLGKSLSCEDFITKCGCKDGYEDHGNVCIKPKPGCHLSTTPETSRGTFPPRTRPTSPRGSTTTTTPRDACDVNDECHMDNDPRTCEQIADKAKIPGCEESDDYYLCLGKSLSCENFITKCGCKDEYEDHGNVCIKPKPGCHLSTTTPTQGARTTTTTTKGPARITTSTGLYTTTVSEGPTPQITTTGKAIHTTRPAPGKSTTTTEQTVEKSTTTACKLNDGMLDKEIIPTGNIKTKTTLSSKTTVDNTRRNVKGAMILKNKKGTPITITIELSQVSEVHSVAIFSKDLTSVKIGTKISQDSKSYFSQYMDADGNIPWETNDYTAHPDQRIAAPVAMPTIEITITIRSNRKRVRVEIEVWGCFGTPGTTPEAPETTTTSGTSTITKPSLTTTTTGPGPHITTPKPVMTTKTEEPVVTTTTGPGPHITTPKPVMSTTTKPVVTTTTGPGPHITTPQPVMTTTTEKPVVITTTGPGPRITTPKPVMTTTVKPVVTTTTGQGPHITTPKPVMTTTTVKAVVTTTTGPGPHITTPKPVMTTTTTTEKPVVTTTTGPGPHITTPIPVMTTTTEKPVVTTTTGPGPRITTPKPVMTTTTGKPVVTTTTRPGPHITTPKQVMTTTTEKPVVTTTTGPGPHITTPKPVMTTTTVKPVVTTTTRPGPRITTPKPVMTTTEKPVVTTATGPQETTTATTPEVQQTTQKPIVDTTTERAASTTEGETSATGTTTIQVSAGTQETKTPETTQTTSGFGLITRTKPTAVVTTTTAGTTTTVSIPGPTTTQNIIMNATKTTPQTSRGTFPPHTPMLSTTTESPEVTTTSKLPEVTTTTRAPVVTTTGAQEFTTTKAPYITTTEAPKITTSTKVSVKTTTTKAPEVITTQKVGVTTPTRAPERTTTTTKGPAVTTTKGTPTVSTTMKTPVVSTTTTESPETTTPKGHEITTTEAPTIATTTQKEKTTTKATTTVVSTTSEVSEVPATTTPSVLQTTTRIATPTVGTTTTSAVISTTITPSGTTVTEICPIVDGMTEVNRIPDDAIEVTPLTDGDTSVIRPGDKGLVIDSANKHAITITLANDKVPSGPYVVAVSLGENSNVNDAIVEAKKPGDNDFTKLHEGKVTGDKISFPVTQATVIKITLVKPIKEGTDYIMHLSIHACYNVTVMTTTTSKPAVSTTKSAVTTTTTEKEVPTKSTTVEYTSSSTGHITTTKMPSTTTMKGVPTTTRISTAIVTKTTTPGGTTTAICELRNGLENPYVIPDSAISGPTGSDGSEPQRIHDDGWTGSLSENPAFTVQLMEDGATGPPPMLDHVKITAPGVKKVSIEVSVQNEDGTTSTTLLKDVEVPSTGEVPMENKQYATKIKITIQRPDDYNDKPTKVKIEIFACFPKQVTTVPMTKEPTTSTTTTTVKPVVTTMTGLGPRITTPKPVMTTTTEKPVVTTTTGPGPHITTPKPVMTTTTEKPVVTTTTEPGPHITTPKPVMTTTTEKPVVTTTTGPGPHITTPKPVMTTTTEKPVVTTTTGPGPHITTPKPVMTTTTEKPVVTTTTGPGPHTTTPKPVMTTTTTEKPIVTTTIGPGPHITTPKLVMTTTTEKPVVTTTTGPGPHITTPKPVMTTTTEKPIVITTTEPGPRITTPKPVITTTREKPVITTTTGPGPHITTPKPVMTTTTEKPVVTTTTVPGPHITTPKPVMTTTEKPVVATTTGPGPHITTPKPVMTTTTEKPVATTTTGPGPHITTPKPVMTTTEKPVVTTTIGPGPHITTPKPVMTTTTEKPVVTTTTGPGPRITTPKPVITTTTEKPVVTTTTGPGPHITTPKPVMTTREKPVVTTTTGPGPHITTPKPVMTTTEKPVVTTTTVPGPHITTPKPVMTTTTEKPAVTTTTGPGSHITTPKPVMTTTEKPVVTTTTGPGPHITTSKPVMTTTTEKSVVTTTTGPGPHITTPKPVITTTTEKPVVTTTTGPGPHITTPKPVMTTTTEKPVVTTTTGPGPHITTPKPVMTTTEKPVVTTTTGPGPTITTPKPVMTTTTEKPVVTTTTGPQQTTTTACILTDGMSEKEIIPASMIHTSKPSKKKTTIDNLRIGYQGPPAGPAVLSNLEYTTPIAVTIKLAELNEVHAVTVISGDLSSVKISSKITPNSQGKYSQYLNKAGEATWEIPSYETGPEQRISAPEPMPTIEITVTVTSSEENVRLQIEVWGCFEKPGTTPEVGTTTIAVSVLTTSPPKHTTTTIEGPRHTTTTTTTSPPHKTTTTKRPAKTTTTLMPYKTTTTTTTTAAPTSPPKHTTTPATTTTATTTQSTRPTTTRLFTMPSSTALSRTTTRGPHCSDGMVPTDCVCKRTCDTIADDLTCPIAGDDDCRIGCHCPNGTAFREGKCHKETTCPCYLDKLYKENDVVEIGPCNKVKCTDDGFIPIIEPCNETCTDGRELMPKPCERTCTNPEPNCAKANPHPGCACPDDLYWDGNECVKTCLCVYGDKEFEVGEKWTRDECVSCKCMMRDGVATARCSERCDITVRECEAKGEKLKNVDLDDEICCKCVPITPVCVDNGKHYTEGTSWTEDVCTHKKCVKDGEGGLMVNVTITTCPVCAPWEIPKSQKPYKCCDKCIPVPMSTTTSSFISTTWNGTTVIIVTPPTPTVVTTTPRVKNATTTVGARTTTTTKMPHISSTTTLAYTTTTRGHDISPTVTKTSTPSRTTTAATTTTRPSGCEEPELSKCHEQDPRTCAEIYSGSIIDGITACTGKGTLIFMCFEPVESCRKHITKCGCKKGYQDKNGVCIKIKDCQAPCMCTTSNGESTKIKEGEMCSLDNGQCCQCGLDSNGGNYKWMECTPGPCEAPRTTTTSPPGPKTTTAVHKTTTPPVDKTTTTAGVQTTTTKPPVVVGTTTTTAPGSPSTSAGPGRHTTTPKPVMTTTTTEKSVVTTTTGPGPRITTPKPVMTTTTEKPVVTTTTGPGPHITTPKPVMTTTTEKPVVTTTTGPGPHITTPKPVMTTTTEKPVVTTTTGPGPHITTPKPVMTTTTEKPVVITTTGPGPHITTPKPVMTTTTEKPVVATTTGPGPRITTPKPVMTTTKKLVVTTTTGPGPHITTPKPVMTTTTEKPVVTTTTGPGPHITTPKPVITTTKKPVVTTTTGPGPHITTPKPVMTTTTEKTVVTTTTGPGPHITTPKPVMTTTTEKPVVTTTTGPGPHITTPKPVMTTTTEKPVVTTTTGPGPHITTPKPVMTTTTEKTVVTTTTGPGPRITTPKQVMTTTTENPVVTTTTGPGPHITTPKPVMTTTEKPVVTTTTGPGPYITTPKPVITTTEKPVVTTTTGPGPHITTPKPVMTTTTVKPVITTTTRPGPHITTPKPVMTTTEKPVVTTTTGSGPYITTPKPVMTTTMTEKPVVTTTTGPGPHITTPKPVMTTTTTTTEKPVVTTTTGPGPHITTPKPVMTTTTTEKPVVTTTTGPGPHITTPKPVMTTTTTTTEKPVVTTTTGPGPHVTTPKPVMTTTTEKPIVTTTTGPEPHITTPKPVMTTTTTTEKPVVTTTTGPGAHITTPKPVMTTTEKPVITTTTGPGPHITTPKPVITTTTTATPLQTTTTGTTPEVQQTTTARGTTSATGTTTIQVSAGTQETKTPETTQTTSGFGLITRPKSTAVVTTTTAETTTTVSIPGPTTTQNIIMNATKTTPQTSRGTFPPHTPMLSTTTESPEVTTTSKLPKVTTTTRAPVVTTTTTGVQEFTTTKAPYITTTEAPKITTSTKVSVITTTTKAPKVTTTQKVGVTTTTRAPERTTTTSKPEVTSTTQRSTPSATTTTPATPGPGLETSTQSTTAKVEETTTTKESGVSTTPMVTSPHSPTSTTKLPGTTTMTTTKAPTTTPRVHCTVGDKKYDVSTTWKEDCMVCKCLESGEKQCEEKHCPTTCDGDLVKVEGECCKVCVPKSKCKTTVTKRNITDKNGCKSKTPIEEGECAGPCMDSNFKLNPIDGNLEGECTCCKPISMSEAKVQLFCDNGETVTHTYIKIDNCSCQGCAVDPVANNQALFDKVFNIK